MKKWSNGIALLLLAAFIVYFHFYKLTYLPFRVWDEARLATSAYEMSKTGDLLVTTLNYKPELIGTKPPMMIWAQVACIKLFGFNEFAIRFPAAVSATLTILIAFLFVYRLTKSKWAALVSAIVLCTAQGYLFDHGSRYGEYEAMLIFFTTASLISFCLYTEATGERRNRLLLLFFFLLSMAALTKGIAAMLFAPALAVYLVARKQFVSTLLNRYFYLGVFIFVVIVGSFYGLREFKSHGYLQAVYEQELGGRFNASIDGHEGPWDFYWAIMKNEGFGNWYWALPVSLGLFWFFPNGKLKRITGFCLLTSISMIAIISLSQTKLSWYSWPAIPLFAIIIGVLIDQLSAAAGAILKWNKEIVAVIFVTIFSLQPTTEAIDGINKLGYDLSSDNFYAASYYFRDAVQGKKDLKGYTYLNGGYDMQWKLYADWLNDIGRPLPCNEYFTNPQLKKGDKLIANFPASKAYIENNYQYKVVEDFYGVRNYIITGVK